jgi:predicted Zn-dependent protease
MNSAVFKTIWTAGALLAVAACVHIPETGQSAFMMVSPSQEAAMGAQSFEELKRTKKISQDPAANAQVRRVTDRLIRQVAMPEARWEVLVFEDPTPNAFALPGGKMGVHTGILPLTQSDDGLAVVMGHEIAHVKLRHGGQRFSQQFGIMLGYSALGIALQNEDWKTRQLFMTAAGIGSQVFLTLPFSRQHEYEADRIGLTYMAQAGFNPNEAPKFWRRMQGASGGGKPPEWLSTHPSDENRIRQLEQLLPQAEIIYRQKTAGL